MKTLSLAVLLMLLVSCSFNKLGNTESGIPLQLRPDTKRLAGMLADTSILGQTIPVFAAAGHVEAGICFYGDVRDTTIVNEEGDTVGVSIVFISRAVAALTDSATPVRVHFQQTPYVNGCDSPNLVAMGHDHLGVPPFFPCTFSDQDALFLADDKRLLLELVFCSDGRAQMLWQDGRRFDFRWAPETK